jgi:ectoine hydroxylase-related dioxygenase (phytanoyl-CoA dioxygenase family)
MTPSGAKLAELAEVGLTILPQVVEGTAVATLRGELVAAIEEDLRLRPDVFDAGMVHNCMVRGPAMAALLDHRLMNATVQSVLGETCILYAYQSSSLPPHGQTNYGRRIHRDSPRFIPEYPTNVGVILALDDFTEENGATHYMPGSHKMEGLPTEDEFRHLERRAFCQAGDMVIFQARLMHCSGINRTGEPRHALTLNLCRSYMRQRFDFPRLVPAELIASLGPDGQRLIGMNVRVPTSLDEFYLPEAERLYKPNQG